jgi:hypothetical protein
VFATVLGREEVKEGGIYISLDIEINLRPKEKLSETSDTWRPVEGIPVRHLVTSQSKAVKGQPPSDRQESGGNAIHSSSPFERDSMYGSRDTLANPVSSSKLCVGFTGCRWGNGFGLDFQLRTPNAALRENGSIARHHGSNTRHTAEEH